MNTLPTPPAVAAPFAALGSARNNIPNLTQTAFGGATLQQGFPPETSVPISNGGIPPSRKDLNGMGYIATFPQYFLQMGGYYTYDPNVADAIGGYPYGAVLTYYDSSGGEVRKLRSMVPNNTHNFVTSPGVIGNYWEDVTPVVGVGRTMFEFFWNYTKEIPAGALWLDGTNLSGCNNPSSPYYDFYTEGKRLAAAGMLATKTMAEYAAELEVNNTCNAFVFDQNNDGTTQAGRMRIPRISHHFIEAVTPSSSVALGSKHLEGLPNITGSAARKQSGARVALFEGGATVSGAFSPSVQSVQSNVDMRGGSATYITNLVFDASKSNAVYGRSNRVQPRSIELIPCIQYAKGVGNAGGGSTSGGITPGQASSIASQVVESGSFNCSGSYNHLGGLQVSGVDVATVQGVSDAYLPSSGGWTATVSSGGVINQLSMVESGGAVVTRLSSVYVPPSSSPWAFASGTAAYRLEYGPDNMVSGAFVYDPATSQWGSTITRWNGTAWVAGAPDDVWLNALLNEGTGAITISMGDNVVADDVRLTGSGAVVETSSGVSPVEDIPRFYSVNVVASGGATSGGYVLSGTSYNIFDKLANGGGGGSGGITSAEAEQIAKQAALPKNSAWTTTVGGYTLSFDGNGGFTVSYSHYDEEAEATTIQSAVFSNGAIRLIANDGEADTVTNVNVTGGAISASYDGGGLGASANVSMGYNGISAYTTGGGGEVTLELSNDTGGITANGSAITQVSSEFGGTSLGIAELSGGVKYVCQSPLSALSIGSAAPGCNAAILFTLANGAVVTPPGNVPLFGVSAYTPGSRYVMAVNGDMAVVAEAVEV